ncbi:MAG: hydantoinase B/oxoprolinase family protein, partial [Candidatus Hydrothermarchaeales archaeon]
MERLMAQARTKEFGKPHPDLDPPEVYRPPYTLKEPPIEVDPITYEIIMHRLWYLTISFGETLKNVSGSIVAAEANDMSTFITLEDGAPVFIGPYIVFHAGTADMVISNTIRYSRDDPGINDGDMFFCNDPYLGAPHQPDCVIVCPIFVDGELFCWSGSTLHQVDIGGIDPGGMCVNARDCYAEPNLYPVVKIVENDKFKLDIDRMLRKNSRLPDIIALDFRAMISANIVAKRSMLEIVDKYGKDVVKSVMIMVQNKASEAFKEGLKKLPRGKFRGREFNEIGGTAPELQNDIYETDCTVINTGEKLIFDYTGTSKQSTGFANCS